MILIFIFEYWFWFEQFSCRQLKVVVSDVRSTNYLPTLKVECFQARMMMAIHAPKREQAICSLHSNIGVLYMSFPMQVDCDNVTKGQCDLCLKGYPNPACACCYGSSWYMTYPNTWNVYPTLHTGASFSPYWFTGRDRWNHGYHHPGHHPRRPMSGRSSPRSYSSGAGSRARGSSIRR